MDWNIFASLSASALSLSHPTRVRGLKSLICRHALLSCLVALPVSAWIEMIVFSIGSLYRLSRTLTGAWIEILLLGLIQLVVPRRTLHGCVDWNLVKACLVGIILRRTLRGCVDWNSSFKVLIFICMMSHSPGMRGLKYGWRRKAKIYHYVALPVSAWIEIWEEWEKMKGLNCRILRGCVDWNKTLI